ncbi:MAG: type II toxin-antitoxin system VapC family toxin [Verrucomicrobiae bacterium]|nr:type II toxin-antitoxin system VapC family toxin [Verrucomicrobiae bacterium]
MPLTHLLDTSVYCQPLKPKPLPSVIGRWKILGDETLCTSIFCWAEVRQGLYLKNSDRLWEAFQEELDGRYPILDFDRASADHFARINARLRSEGRPKPSLDILIASTARAHGLILATCNYRDFDGIEGLAVEDWTHP